MLQCSLARYAGLIQNIQRVTRLSSPETRACWNTELTQQSSVFSAFFKKSKLRHPGIVQSRDSGTRLIFFIDLIVTFSKFPSDLINAHDRKIGDES
jgi:hypothetical protein